MPTENDALEIVRIASEVPADAEVSFQELQRVSPIAEAFPGGVNPATLARIVDGVTAEEVLARFLYLSCVQDQGGEIVGVRLFLERVVNRLYQDGHRILHRPGDFLARVGEMVDVIDEEHRAIREARRVVTEISAYTLLDQSTLVPSVLFRWGTPLAVLARLERHNHTLLSWVRSWAYAAELKSGSPRLRMDPEFGLGMAIGHKASWLFMKLLIHTFPILRIDGNPAWDRNSYQIPLDQNVGRVLMRSGLVFAFVEEDEFIRACCQRQSDGRTNLGANRMRELKVSTDTRTAREALRIRRTWQPQARSVKFPLLLNALAASQGTTIGAIDDGIMHIGRHYCANTVQDMRCEECPLERVCYARNQAPRYIEEFYCGAGEGTFQGR